jgi:6-phosphogluconolactonase
MTEVTIARDAADLAWTAASYIVGLAKETIAARARFTVAISGGSTPLPVYALLALPEWAARIDWPRVHVFWADERAVPPDHQDSNYLYASAVLLDRVPLPKENIHRMRGEIEPTQAAAEHESLLKQFFGVSEVNSEVRFDLILLGMGDDGHTASLFPGTAAIHEQTHYVIAHYVEKTGNWRITLTPRTINAAANVAFLVSGENKATRLHEVIDGPFQPDQLPAQIVKPTHGNLAWLVDQPAAALLNKGGQK